MTEQDQLIRNIRRGDRNAFRAVFNQYFNTLCSFSFKYLEDKDEVQDLVQDAFITLWEKRKDFEHMLALKSYLYTSVRNKCLNILKHRSVQQKHEKALVYELESEQYFENQVIAEEAFNRLYQEIQLLPQASREIMLLALNGMKNPEIGEELGISVNTVKTQKKIAYAKLKEKLGSFVEILLILLLP